MRYRGILIPESVDLLELMLSRENMLHAWKRVKANGGSSGIDNLSIDDTADLIRTSWSKIKGQIVLGCNKPSAVRRTEIPKGNG